jgi:squalene cyclase
VFDHTTQQVTAVARTPDHLDLFVVGFDNAIWSSYWQPDAEGWRPWFQIHPETVFDHTTQQVTAVARTPDHLDLFVVGFDNAIWSSWWRS